ncbi:MAG: hypothetical protein U1F29_13300 [Planctomycetota bacterium]
MLPIFLLTCLSIPALHQAPFVDAQTSPPFSSSRAGASESHFGRRFATIGDVDGDGVYDHAIGDCSPGSERRESGRVWIFSGKAGTLLGVLEGAGAPDSDRIQGPPTRTFQPSLTYAPAAFGAAFAIAGDVDADGYTDFLVSAWAGAIDEDRSPHWRHGYVRLYSGRELRLLREIPSDADSDGFGSALDAADVDGDGVLDWIIGAPGTSTGGEADRSNGRVLIHGGKDGRLLSVVRSDSPRSDGFGHSVCAVTDMDADGRPDLAIGAPWEAPPDADADADGCVYLASSRGGRILRVLRSEQRRCETGARFGWTLTRTSDQSGDGVPDFLVGCLHSSTRAYSGKGAALLCDYEHYLEPQLPWGAANSMCALSDLDRDGVPEVAVGSEDPSDLERRRSVTVFSGRTGSVLHVIDAGRSFANVANGGDVDGDGLDDLLVGLWQEDRVVVYSGATWFPIRELRRHKR